MTGKKLRWGILGPGGIAREFLAGAAGSALGEVVAIGTRDPDRADLAEHFPGLAVRAGYAALLADPAVDAIYIATPHPFHAEWAVKAAEAGKHVLCEKPAAMNEAEAVRMFAAATRHGTFLAEAFMYRVHPLTAFLLDLLEQGRVGELRLIKASFGFALPAFLPDHRLFAKALGGGAILDLGGYPMSMARLLAGHATGADDVEPVGIAAFSRHGPTGVDEISSALVTFPGGIMADLSCSLALWQDNVLHIQGTAGRLEVDSFWFGSGKTGGTADIRFTPPRGETEVIRFEEARNVYDLQFEAVNRAILAGATRLDRPGMTEADSLANARSLDRWLAAATPVDPPLPAPPPPSPRAG